MVTCNSSIPSPPPSTWVTEFIEGPECNTTAQYYQWQPLKTCLVLQDGYYYYECNTTDITEYECSDAKCSDCTMVPNGGMWIGCTYDSEQINYCV